MDVDVRIFFADVPEQIEIPIESQRRMVPALHQDLNPARGGKFVELLVELFAAQNVMVGVFLGAIKRAELAVNIANIRVIDVAIDDVSHDLAPVIIVAGGLGEVAPGIGELAELRQWPPIKLERFLRRNPFARQHFIGERFFV